MARVTCFTWTTLILPLLTMTLVSGSGFVDIKFYSFTNTSTQNPQNPCKDKERCGFYFEICVLRRCSLSKKRTSLMLPPQVFNSTVGNLSNPVLIPFNSWPTDNRISVIVKRFGTRRSYGSYYIYKKQKSATTWNYTNYERNKSQLRLTFGVKVYCDPDYYGVNCHTYCRAEGRSNDSYSCDPNTGVKACKPGWAGVDCDVDIRECLAQPCKNGATCIDLTHGHSCTCAPGFNGANCENNIDDCVGNQCHVTATCKDEINRYSCICPAERSGVYCRYTDGSCGCRNGATCRDTNKIYTCACAVGFNGSNCENEIDWCASSPCSSNATCKSNRTSYKCLCPKGRKGHYCNEFIPLCVEGICQNGGRCNQIEDRYSCDCPPGFSGSNCEHDINECESSPCLNNGTCVDQTNSFTCMCNERFTGRNCEVEMTPCHSNPCKYGATCRDTGESYSCDCQLGYTGRNCKTDIDDCEEVPCHPEGGTCVDEINGYHCLCANGYSGNNCENTPSTVSPEVTTTATTQETSPSRSFATTVGSSIAGWTEQFTAHSTDDQSASTDMNSDSSIRERDVTETVVPSEPSVTTDMTTSQGEEDTTTPVTTELTVILTSDMTTQNILQTSSSTTAKEPDTTKDTDFIEIQTSEKTTRELGLVTTETVHSTSQKQQTDAEAETSFAGLESTLEEITVMQSISEKSTHYFTVALTTDSTETEEKLTSTSSLPASSSNNTVALTNDSTETEKKLTNTPSLPTSSSSNQSPGVTESEVTNTQDSISKSTSKSQTSMLTTAVKSSVSFTENLPTEKTQLPVEPFRFSNGIWALTVYGVIYVDDRKLYRESVRRVVAEYLDISTDGVDITDDVQTCNRGDEQSISIYAFAVNAEGNIVSDKQLKSAFGEGSQSRSNNGPDYDVNTCPRPVIPATQASRSKASDIMDWLRRYWLFVVVPLALLLLVILLLVLAWRVRIRRRVKDHEVEQLFLSSSSSKAARYSHLSDSTDGVYHNKMYDALHQLDDDEPMKVTIPPNQDSHMSEQHNKDI